MKEELKEALRPIYDKMLKDTSINEWSEIIDGKKCAYPCMAPVVGNNYPKEPRTGFMFYGRATNGWEVGVDDTFDTIYNAQLDGLYKYINEDNDSAFFRVAGRVFSECYGDDWLNHVVYSNLYKVSHPKKNPTDPECRVQLEYVKEIFEKEVETMSPKFVVLLTGENWAKDFVWHINGNEIPAPLETKKWSDQMILTFSIQN